MTDSELSTPEDLAAARKGIQEFFQSFAFNQLLGMELVNVEPGKARLSIAWRADLCQPAGIMHGGVIASLADTAIAHAILLTAPHLEVRTQGGGMVSVDLRLKYLRPVSSGKIYCDARVVRLGRQIIHADAVVTDEAGKDVALADSIYMIVRAEQLQKKPGK